MQETSFQAIVEIAPEIVKDSGDDEFIGYFEGVASTPQIDIEGDAFSVDVLQANAERLKGKEILYGHGKDPALRDAPVGKILDAWIENGVLKIKAGIFKKFADIWDKIKSGILRGLSVGGIAKKVKRETVNVIEDAEIQEVSLAPKPVNPSAQIYHVFGKAFVVEDGVLTIQKVDFDLPIVKRGTWDGDAAAKRIFDWAEKEDGIIDKSKASKLFIVVRGDGENRGDYGWPVGDIVDGKPVLISSGIITAIKYASGARGAVEKIPEEETKHIRSVLERLAKRLKDEGILPEDYEVPWKREEKSLLIEYLILKAMILEERLESEVGRLEKALDDKLSKALDEKLEKRTEIEKTPKSVISSEEVVKKSVSGQDVYRYGSFYALQKVLREIKA